MLHRSIGCAKKKSLSHSFGRDLSHSMHLANEFGQAAASQKKRKNLLGQCYPEYSHMELEDILLPSEGPRASKKISAAPI